MRTKLIQSAAMQLCSREAMTASCAVCLQLRICQEHILQYLAERLSLLIGRCRLSASLELFRLLSDQNLRSKGGQALYLVAISELSPISYIVDVYPEEATMTNQIEATFTPSKAVLQC